MNLFSHYDNIVKIYLSRQNVSNVERV